MPPGWGFDGNTKVIDLEHKVAGPPEPALLPLSLGFCSGPFSSAPDLVQPGQTERGLAGDLPVPQHNEEEAWK